MELFSIIAVSIFVIILITLAYKLENEENKK